MLNQKQITKRWSDIGLLDDIENKDYLANYYEDLLDITMEYSRRRRGANLQQFETTIFPIAFRIFREFNIIIETPMKLFNDVKKFFNNIKHSEMFKELAMVVGHIDAESEMMSLYLTSYREGIRYRTENNNIEINYK